MLAQALSAPSGSLADTSGRTSETAVTIPPTITYGFQDTHTTILPMVYWFSCPNLDERTPTLHAFRLNSIYDIIHKGVPTQTVTANQPYNYKCMDAIYANGATTGEFFPWYPTDSPTIPPAAYYPWYRDTWSKLYNWWTVLGCEYEITLFNPRGSGRSALCAYTIQTEGTTAARTIPDNIRLNELMAMEQIQYKGIEPYIINGMYKQMITGKYKPGQAKRDIQNDGDVKLWTQTAQTPAYNENMRLYFYKDPLSSNKLDTAGPVTEGAADSTHVQVQIRLKYIVQWKNLKQSALYPTTGAVATAAMSFPTSAQPF